MIVFYPVLILIIFLFLNRELDSFRGIFNIHNWRSLCHNQDNKEKKKVVFRRFKNKNKVKSQNLKSKK